MIIWYSICGVSDFSLKPWCSVAMGETASASEKKGNNLDMQLNEPLRLVFLGDSLTAGLGVLSEEAYPSIIADKLKNLGIRAQVENAGVSGDTTAAGYNRLSWALGEKKVSILVLALGANDGLRGLPVQQTKTNLLKIIKQVREHSKDCKIVLAGMKVPPNMGEDYSAAFERIFKEVAVESRVELIAFLLEGVAAKPELNLSDGIHPNAQGYVVIAETVWGAIEPFILEAAK
jgi:acyl-CoA thioesterase-1